MPLAPLRILGLAAIAAGLALGAVIALVWRPCAGTPLPLDPMVPSACADISSGMNTSWISWALWPIALLAAIAILVLVARRRSGGATIAAAAALAVVAVLANPVTEYVLLNLRAQSWDEPPGTGAFTATLFLLAGAVLLVAARGRRATPAAEPARAAR